MMASNKSLAEFNLTYEPKLKDGKATLMALYEKARSLTDELEPKRAQLGKLIVIFLVFIASIAKYKNRKGFIVFIVFLESLSSRTSLDTTYALMQAASAEAEEECDGLSEKFVEGQMDPETFLNQFLPLRTTAHLRRLKCEKMGELISSQRNRASFNSAPYPTIPASMPMPGMM